MKKFLPVLFFAWAFVGSTVAVAAKPVLGVAEFRNETAAGWWGGGVGWELSGMLANELAATGSFRVVERNKLEPVLREQDLGRSGRIRKGTGAKIGQLTGARYLVMGTVSAYQENTKGTGGGFSFKGISIGGKKNEAYIAVDLRVVDTDSGELDYVRTVEAKSGGQGFRVGLHRGGFGGSLKHHEKTPAGRAIRAVIAEITGYLQCAMVYQDDCMSEYAAKEQRRRKSLGDSIKLY